MDSLPKFRLLFHDDHDQKYDLLKKLKGDCIKSMDDTPYKKVVAMLELFASELCDYFLFLHSATGTLAVNISFPVGTCLSLHSSDAEEMVAVAPTSPMPATVPVAPATVPVAKNRQDQLPCDVKLGALKISPRPVTEETANVVDCVDLRPVQVASPSATPVDTPPYPLRLVRLRSHCQVSQTPSRCNSFVDLNPSSPSGLSPLPLPNSFADCILASSSVNKMYEAPLGRGGGGTVSLHPCPKWAVAIKRVSAKNSTEQDYTREADIMRSLKHQNIVGYFGSGFVGDCFNLVIEWMPGGSLKEFIRLRGPFRDKEIVDYSFHLLSGMKYLHDNNIVHHDIKADNLFLDSSGQVLKIGDFGHAQYMVDGVVDCPMEGTVQFMAPEYIQTGKYTTACDVWSVGCVTMEMATVDHLPWPKLSRLELAPLMYKIGTSTDPPDIPAEVSPLVHDLMASCLHLDPHLRPSASELLHHKVFDGYHQPPQHAPTVADLPSIDPVFDSDRT